MKSISILLTDHRSINENIVLKSINKLRNSKLKKIYFIGDKNSFLKIFKITKSYKKFIFIDIAIKKNNYKKYIKDILKKSLKLFNEKKISCLINMPLNKKKYLDKKFSGFTEMFSYFFDKKKNENMLLYNPYFSVCPITTHIKLKDVEKNINKKKLFNTIVNINHFFKNIVKKKNIKIKILGLNPHASKDLNNAKIDRDILKKIVKKFKSKINIEGPVSADTAFLKTKNSVFIGMYHDQVLIPFKMKNEFNGINITIGKKLIRLSPDHGTAINLVGKIKSINTKSFINCVKFCEKYI